MAEMPRPAARRDGPRCAGRRRALALLLCRSTALCAGAPDLHAELFAPERLLDGRAPGGAGGEFVRHPWAIRDRAAEVELERRGEAPEAARNVVTRDGVEAVVSASAAALPPGAVAALYVGLFSFSLTGPEVAVERWMVDGGLPPAHNALRQWTMFAHQFGGGPVLPDELGDACIGEAFRAEFCARVASCLLVAGAPDRGGGEWRMAVPTQHATNYRLEVYLGEPVPECDQRGLDPTYGHFFPWWAPPVAEKAVAPRSAVAQFAAFTRFRLLFVNAVSFWWGQSAAVDPVASWTEMAFAALDAAAASPAANPGAYGLAAAEAAPRGLYLEFGVGSGKTTAAIAARLSAVLGDAGRLHGFDSFEGLPTSWAHTKLGPGTFSTGGEVPEHLQRLSNVEIHVGLFSRTLADLDRYGNTPVAFAHIDVDLYASAVEVLARIACQLLPGSVLLFDELVNYVGFELSGEHRAWEYISSAFGIKWEYAGMYWQQAVPIVITNRGSTC